MALRDRFRRLEKAMRDKLSHFELADGGQLLFSEIELPRREILGNWASDKGGSRKS
jgi:hypothetical protein